jgi:NADPH:quinone reductase-like Zn-dependent oxidoreductase
MTRRRKIFGGIVLFLALAVVALGLVLSHDSPCTPAAAPRAGATTMKAIVHRCYGAPDVLQVEDVEKPVPADDEVLVKVRAAGVNPLDFHYMRGKPYIMRLGSGIGAPSDARMGVDYAGTVEAVGKGVTKFRVGDPVFGGKSGTFAEYITVRESRNIVRKPDNVSFEQAGGVAVAAFTALQALRDQGKLAAGQKVLINGASGGVGTYAVQIAKAMGAHVTGVCSSRNVELVKSLGADRVIDYTREDFTKSGEKYHVIIDTPGNRTLGEYRSVMTDDGRYVLVGGPKTGKWLGPVVTAMKTKMYSPFVSQEFKIVLAQINPQDLAYLARLMAAGKVTTVIDRRYTLAQAREALSYVELGRARGKVVLLLE